MDDIVLVISGLLIPFHIKALQISGIKYSLRIIKVD